jgi:hypothetical protein
MKVFQEGSLNYYTLVFINESFTTTFYYIARGNSIQKGGNHDLMHLLIY